MSDWKRYIEKTKNRGVHQFLKMAMDKYAPESGTFFDVGAGAGNEMDYAKELGFEVAGVDLNPSRPDIVKADMAEFDIPYSDVICSINAISFSPEAIKVLKRIVGRTRKLAIISVFGEEDDWVKGGGCVSFDKDDIRKVFYGFEVVLLNEIKKCGPDVSGRDKNWHIIQFVAMNMQDNPSS